MSNLDFYLFEQINNLAGQWIWLDWLGIFLAEYLGYVLGIILLAFLFFKKKNFWLVGLAFASAILARLVLTNLIRWFIYRPRPFIADQVNLLMSHKDVSSFPSGHTAFFFALSVSIFFFNKKAGSIFLVASLFIGLARVFVGIHYPLDILAGAVVGVFSAWLINKCFKKIKRGQTNKKIDLCYF
ncbi:MAG TPA: phosphatase PAP2 family protein [Candidatus Portnoybacteria bacterium]|nr:phosphatase PAP2 family protein [Candidatus Portnoybacteria bacterium]